LAVSTIFFKVLGAADAVFFADFKQRALARQIVRNGGLLFLGGEVAGFFARGQPAGAFGLIDAQPLAHGGVADADTLRGGLTADLAGYYFFPQARPFVVEKALVSGAW